MKHLKTRLLSACAALAFGLSAVTMTMTVTAPTAHAITEFGRGGRRKGHDENLLGKKGFLKDKSQHEGGNGVRFAGSGPGFNQAGAVQGAMNGVEWMHREIVTIWNRKIIFVQHAPPIRFNPVAHVMGV